jgi:hypothetical protein
LWRSWKHVIWVFEGVAFCARAKDPALDKDCLHEGNDGEGDMNENVGSA